jgi:hypothetical protein
MFFICPFEEKVWEREKERTVLHTHTVTEFPMLLCYNSSIKNAKNTREEKGVMDSVSLYQFNCSIDLVLIHTHPNSIHIHRHCYKEVSVTLTLTLFS